MDAADQIEALAGTARLPPILVPVQLSSAVPEGGCDGGGCDGGGGGGGGVLTFTCVATALRRCVRLCVLLENQVRESIGSHGF